MAAVLAWAKQDKVKLSLEIKNIPTDVDYDPTSAFADTVLGGIEASGIPKSQVLIQSFWPANLDRAKAKGFQTSYLVLSQVATKENLRLVEPYTLVSPGWPVQGDAKAYVDAAHAMGKPVIPYTLDTAKDQKDAHRRRRRRVHHERHPDRPEDALRAGLRQREVGREEGEGQVQEGQEAGSEEEGEEGPRQGDQGAQGRLHPRGRMTVDVWSPRFTDVKRGAGFYESFYLRACDPAARRGVWIRYTVHKEPNAEPHASLWFCLWDPENGAPYAVKQSFSATSLGSGDSDLIRIADATLTKRGAAGAADGEGRHADWELTIDPRADPLTHLPYDRMYSGPLPRTKTLSPAPVARFGGRITAGDRTVDADGWVGMLGHNWGAQHAERWIWMHGVGFDGSAADGTWLDAAIGRIKVGPITSPWIGNGELSLGGTRYRLGGLEKTRSVKVEETPNRAHFVLPGDEVTVKGEVGADRSDFVGWIYSDPDGGRHDAVNCSIASMKLTVERDGAEPIELSTAGGAVYELGMRERDHGIALQPFTDP